MEAEEKSSGKISAKIKQKRAHYKSTLLPFRDIFMAITVVLAVLAFFLVKSCSNSLTGMSEITVIQKFVEGTAYVVVDSNNISHYVDQESYKMAVLNTTYRIEQYEYTEHLRPLKPDHFKF